MNNNEVRQISEEEIQKELSKEQLQQTQVLNFQEVQKAIHFEKVTSKKPAILVAIIGVFCMLLGGSLQIASTLNTKPQNIQKRAVKETIEEKKLNCVKTSLNNPDGTNTTYKIVYKFENNKLSELTKEYNISAIADKEEGKKSIEKYINEYSNLLNDTQGYSIETSSTSNIAMNIKIIVDYKELDLTKLNEKQQTNPYTKVDYSKNATYEKIKEEALEQGFKVE